MATQLRSKLTVLRGIQVKSALRAAYFLFFGVYCFSSPIYSQSATCRVNVDLPIGVTNQKGYSFDYQSGKGAECRRYRLRNEPGKVLTPALWKDQSEVFLDVDLAACSSGSACPWVHVVKISSTQPTKGETTLSYGVNKDECTDNPDAFRKKSGSGSLFEPFVTIIEGLVGDPKGKPIQIKIQAISTLERGENGTFTLTYDLEVLSSMEKFQFLSPEETGRENEAYGVHWYSAASKPLLDELKGKEWSKLEGDAPHVKAVISSKDVEIDERGLLALYKGSRQIAATTAPAYRPKGE